MESYIYSFTAAAAWGPVRKSAVLMVFGDNTRQPILTILGMVEAEVAHLGTW